MEGGEKNSLSPTPLSAIRRKVLAYHKKMNAIAKFLKKRRAPKEIQLDTSKEFMEFYIEKKDFVRLTEIALLPDFERFAVFFGLAIGNNSVTSCFLGIDKENNILEEHRKSNLEGRGVPGEDTWIPPGNGFAKSDQDFTLDTPYEKIEEHFHD